MNTYPLSRAKLLAHLHKLATGFAATGNGRLSNEMLTLIDQIERGEFDDLTGNNNSGLNYERP